MHPLHWYINTDSTSPATPLPPVHRLDCCWDILTWQYCRVSISPLKFFYRETRTGKHSHIFLKLCFIGIANPLTSSVLSHSLGGLVWLSHFLLIGKEEGEKVLVASTEDLSTLGEGYLSRHTLLLHIQRLTYTDVQFSCISDHQPRTTRYCATWPVCEEHCSRRRQWEVARAFLLMETLDSPSEFLTAFQEDLPFFALLSRCS